MTFMSYNYRVVFFAALGSLTYGFSNSVIGSVLGLPSFFEYFDLNTTGPGAAKANAIVGATNGVFAGGGAIGAIILTWLADKVGRVRTIQITCVLCICSGALQAGSAHIAMFLIGRLISGIGVGLMVTLIPIYQSEISPAVVRGRMVGSHGFLIVTGYAVAAWIGYSCFFSNNQSFQWRFPLAAQCISPLTLLIGSPWLPESPRWLIQREQTEAAFEILCKLHDDPSEAGQHVYAREEIFQMRMQLEVDRKYMETAGKWALFTTSSYRKRLLIGCFTQFITQSTAVLVVNNYQVLLYNSLGLFNSLPLLLYAVYLSWAAAMNYVSSRIMDRVGRVRLLIIGLVGCLICISAESAMVAEFSGTTNKIGNGFGVLFLFLFVTFYGASLDATSYVYCAEIFPTHIRAQGMGVSLFAQFTTTLLYTEVAPTAFAAIGWKYYLVFILVPAFGVVLIWFTFPETKGLSLEEVGAAFGDEVAVDITHLDSVQRKDLDERLKEDASAKIMSLHTEKV